MRRHRHHLSLAVYQGSRLRTGRNTRTLPSRSSALFGADWPARNAPLMNSSRGMAEVLSDHGTGRWETAGVDGGGPGRCGAAWRLLTTRERVRSRVDGGESAAASGTESLAERGRSLARLRLRP